MKRVQDEEFSLTNFNIFLKLFCHPLQVYVRTEIKVVAILALINFWLLDIELFFSVDHFLFSLLHNLTFWNMRRNVKKPSQR